MSALPLAAAEKLAKVCSLFGSDSDGERSAAALAAHKLLTQNGLGWNELLLPATMRPQTWAKPYDATISELRRWLLASDRLNSWERIFVRSIQDHWVLSAKQMAKFDAIIAKVAA